MTSLPLRWAETPLESYRHEEEGQKSRLIRSEIKTGTRGTVWGQSGDRVGVRERPVL
jgi:hypothetical protein